MAGVLDPSQFVMIALASWMRQRQLQMIDYLGEENSQIGCCGLGD
jgi:hypothetical protein